MALYIEEVDVDVLDEPTAQGAHGLTPEQLEALVDAVLRALSERRRRAAARDEDARISGRNRPESAGD